MNKSEFEKLATIEREIDLAVNNRPKSNAVGAMIEIDYRSVAWLAEKLRHIVGSYYGDVVYDERGNAIGITPRQAATSCVEDSRVDQEVRRLSGDGEAADS